MLFTDSQTVENFKVYPNPTKDQFTISYPENKRKITVSIIDILGKTVQKNTFRNTNELNISHQLSSGMYIVKLENNDEASKFNYKLIVE